MCCFVCFVRVCARMCVYVFFYFNGFITFNISLLKGYLYGLANLDCNPEAVLGSKIMKPTWALAFKESIASGRNRVRPTDSWNMK